MTTKQLITEFNFPNPDWNNLPSGFPRLDKAGLTRQEGHLLDGIKLAWIASEGRDVFYKSLARRTVVGIVILILAILVGKNLITATDKSLTHTVSAKTVSQKVEEVIEATMSAVFK